MAEQTYYPYYPATPDPALTTQVQEPPPVEYEWAKQPTEPVPDGSNVGGKLANSVRKNQVNP